VRPVAFLTRAFAGCRAKCYAMCEQIFGPDSVDVYRLASAPSDLEFLGSDADHTYQKNPDEVIDEVLEHEYIHGFCDNTSLLRRLVDSGEPFIAHQHDIYSMRAADYFEPHLHTAPNVVKVLTSSAHMEYLTKRWGVPESEYAIVYNLPVLAWQPEVPQPVEKVKDSVVYFGGIQIDPTAETGYRFYLPQWRSLVEAGIQVHVYTHGMVTRHVHDTFRSHPLMFIHNRIPHGKLYEELAKYEVGFAGYNDLGGVPKASREYCVTCLPNKTWDYMFAGIPTLAYNMGVGGPLVAKWGMNTTMNNLVRDFKFLTGSANGSGIHYEDLREECCMETQKGLLEHLYQKVRRDT
jgi:hypothetical protein